MNARALFGIGAFVLVATGLVLGFSVLGSPANNRAIAIDQARISEMQQIADTISERAKDARKAPAKLPPEYADDVKVRGVITYAPLLERNYQLCTTFLQTGDDTEQTAWKHPAGRWCFTLTTKETTPRSGSALGL